MTKMLLPPVPSPPLCGALSESDVNAMIRSSTRGGFVVVLPSPHAAAAMPIASAQHVRAVPLVANRCIHMAGTSGDNLEP
jgi:hypothetical protein